MDQLDSSTLNELELFSEINHNNIVRYFDYFHRRIGSEHQTFIITEYCEVNRIKSLLYKSFIDYNYLILKNGDLRNKIEEAKRQNIYLDDRQLLDWMIQSTNALKYLHSIKPDPIIHRDIKPE